MTAISQSVFNSTGAAGSGHLSGDEARRRLEAVERLLDGRHGGPRRSSATRALCQEVASLVTDGLDVAFTFPVDRQGLTAAQDEVTEALIRDMEEAADGRERFLRYPAINAWDDLKMRAISLHPLYLARDAGILGAGIDPAVYDKPMFNTPDGEFASASEILREQLAAAGKAAAADAIIARYHRFLPQPIDEGSRLIWGSGLDGRGVRTRAYQAISMVVDHFADGSDRIRRRNLRTASLACGAAGPMRDLVCDIRAAGGEFAQLNLVDMDPMALATASSVLGPVSGDAVFHLQNLSNGSLTRYLAPQSIDIADLLGLFEYFPDHLAARLLGRVREIMRPGGIVVFGNMVKDRGQQKFFTDVVAWPRLLQRSIAETLAIIARAGFDPTAVSVRVPAREGVYAIYGIRIP